MKQRQSILWRTFLAFFGVNIFAVFILCVAKPENNLPTSKLIILPSAILCAFVLLGLWQKGISVFLEKYTRLLFPMIMITYGIVLFLVSINSRSAPVHDQEAVYQGALYFAGLSEKISWEYFARCNNNIIPTVLLGIVFRIGSFGGRIDPYYFAVIVNIFQVLISMYCVFQLSKSRNGIFSAWISVIMRILYIPVVGHTLSLYTDSMSFCFAILGLYLWEIKTEIKSKWLYWGWNIFVGILMGLAASIKMTAAIVVIALLIYSCLEKTKKLILRSFTIILCTVSVILLAGYYTSQLPCENMLDSHGTPRLSYWLGIGIKGNGGYIDNQYYSEHLNTIYGMQQKEEWSRQYIKENIRQFWNSDHIVQKVRYNFANGGLGCSIFVQNLDTKHILHRLMHYDGSYYWRYSMLTTAYMYSVYSLILIGAIIQLFNKKKENACLKVPLITIFGLMLYLMLFEANNRQLYNHLPLLALGASNALSDIWNIVFKRNC